MTDNPSQALPADEVPISPIDPQSVAPEEDLEPTARPLPERHTRKCQICRHPERAWIEVAFVNWQSARVITLEYNLSDRSVVYRLYERRRLKGISFFENIMENAYYTPVTSSTLIAAAHAFLKMANSDSAGRGSEPRPETVQAVNQSLN